jgi:hypothetical protein
MRMLRAPVASKRTDGPALRIPTVSGDFEPRSDVETVLDGEEFR